MNICKKELKIQLMKYKNMMMVYMKLKKFQNKENLNNKFKIKDQIVIMNQYFQKLVFL